MNQKINSLIFALNYSWSKETSHESVKDIWNEENKALGQCAITSLIVQDLFGGEIVYGSISDSKINHYWNIINGEEIDLTKSQFSKDAKIIKIGIKEREKLLNNIDTFNRYKLLKSKIDKFYYDFNEIENDINKCRLCGLDKTFGNNIYFGTRIDILIIGEAPAKNGWRITGKAWINEKGNIIPSGKILDKLFNNINLSLFDFSFIEIIKCFPSERKNLKEYGKNCLNFFEKQIGLLKPKLIITLGEIPTRILLKDIKFNNLSEIVGKKFNYNENILIIPIYHPSPISPKSFIDNKPIFDNIINNFLGKN